jgi:hypothetical protein
MKSARMQREAAGFEHLARDEDRGEREGALGFLVTCLGGVVVAAALVPGGLTMFWVWMLILSGAMAGGAATQALAGWNNRRGPQNG